MNREIKFRAWNEDAQEMYEVAVMYGEDASLKVANINRYLEIVGICDDPIMQFTGLQDKKGQDIYEGDIIEVESRYNECFLVDFKKGGFIARSIEHENEFWLSDWSKLDKKIVGNKYEGNNA